MLKDKVRKVIVTAAKRQAEPLFFPPRIHPRIKLSGRDVRVKDKNHDACTGELASGRKNDRCSCNVLMKDEMDTPTPSLAIFPRLKRWNKIDSNTRIICRPSIRSGERVSRGETIIVSVERNADGKGRSSIPAEIGTQINDMDLLNHYFLDSTIKLLPAC